MTPEPIDPITSLMECMAAMHELFISMTKSGFTDQQALYMLGVFMASQGGRATET